MPADDRGGVRRRARASVPSSPRAIRRARRDAAPPGSSPASARRACPVVSSAQPGSGSKPTRTGRPVSAATRLLLTAGEVPAPELRRHLVLHVADEELADGLLQWPQTRSLIAERLGPTALAVEEEQAGLLRERLKAAGILVESDPSTQ
jgi:hypothetical protein